MPNATLTHRLKRLFRRKRVKWELPKTDLNFYTWKVPPYNEMVFRPPNAGDGKYLYSVYANGKTQNKIITIEGGEVVDEKELSSD